MDLTTFGFSPLPLTVQLTKDADFSQVLTTPDGADWPVGAVIALNLVKGTDPPVVWTATISGPDATLFADKADVNALGPKSAIKLTVTYTDGAGTDLTWWVGTVEWTAGVP